MKTEQSKNKPIEEPNLDINSSNETIADFLSDYLTLKYKEKDFRKYLYISVKHQRIYLIQNDSITHKYSISSSISGIGNLQGSNKTPHGLHSIEKKIGKNVPYGGILKSRIYTGKTATILTDKVKSPTDDVTSRIMWLKGEEPGLNKGKKIDSYKRYIYIHGTSEEGYIGEPASHGCIRMKNNEVIELFSLVEKGTPVLILKY